MTELLYGKKDGIALLTLNRPERKNALTPQMMVRLAEAWLDFRADDDARVAVLTGAGNTFTAGADLARLIPLLTRARKPEDDWDRRLLEDKALFQTAVLRRFELYKPVIAAINGAALAGGCEIILATDLRIATPEASLGLSEAKRGIVPGAGSLARLARQIPYCEAMRIMLLGDSIPAAEALRIGLINEIVPAERLLPRALRAGREARRERAARAAQDQGGGAAQRRPPARGGVRHRGRVRAGRDALRGRARGAARVHGEAPGALHRALSAAGRTKVEHHGR